MEGYEINKLANELGYSRQQMADRMGISRSHLNNLIAGHRVIYPHHERRIEQIAEESLVMEGRDE